MRTRIGLFIAVAIGSIAAATYGQQTASPAFGTTNTTYYRVGTTDFKAYAYSDVYFDDGRSLWPPSASTGWFNATPHLPSGALLTYLELDYCDTNTMGLHLQLHLQDCDPISGNCTSTGLGSMSSEPQPVDAPCASASVALNHTINNATEVLNLYVNFGAFDQSVILRGVVIGYKLQVGPAPATPTFNDVPATDPGFQYVEALAASGITGGCGGGNYCPDNPVTRRQIAVMLAKALGLSFN